VSRIEVWAIDESRVERMAEYPFAWRLLLVLGIAWILLAIVILSFHVETLTTLAAFTGIVFVAGGVSTILRVASIRRGRRWFSAALGAGALGLGVVLLAWPSPTLYVVAVMVGWYLVVMGIVHFVQALFRTFERYWWADLLLGLAEFVIGAWAASYPGKSLSVFATLIGVYALVHGVIQIFGAFALRGLERDLRVAAG
jgi:uncharacterized membrane protein HdeD (DUF308 family)